MDPKFQTSFIPKKPLIQTTNVKPARTTNLFTLISSIIFITVLVLSAGVFGYKFYLTRANATLALELDSYLQRFEPELIAQLSRDDARIESGKTLLNQHIAVTSLMEFLSRVTLSSVRFTTFSYVADARKVTLNMTGEAKNFAAVALQSDEFLKEANKPYIQNPLFSNLTLDKSGNVKFDFTGTMDASKISYKNLIKQAEASIPTQ